MESSATFKSDIEEYLDSAHEVLSQCSSEECSLILKKVQKQIVLETTMETAFLYLQEDQSNLKVKSYQLKRAKNASR